MNIQGQRFPILSVLFLDASSHGRVVSSSASENLADIFSHSIFEFL